MNILVACEESQAVCLAFRQKGHRAFSCDIVECSGGHPEWYNTNTHKHSSHRSKTFPAIAQAMAETWG